MFLAVRILDCEAPIIRAVATTTKVTQAMLVAVMRLLNRNLQSEW